MAFFPYSFLGSIEHHELGTMRYTVVWLPAAIGEQLPFHEQSRLRISGEIDDQPFTGAWQPSRGRWYLMLGKPLLKAAGLSVGDVAEIRFRLEPLDQVDVPPALAAALARSDGASSTWSDLPPGKQRAVAIYVGSAKTAPTRRKRLAQAVCWLEQGARDLRALPKMAAPQP